MILYKNYTQLEAEGKVNKGGQLPSHTLPPNFSEIGTSHPKLLLRFANICIPVKFVFF